MRVVIEQDYAAMSSWAAEYVIKRVNTFNPTPNRPFVLGLPTGSTPIGMYQELSKACQGGRISFKNVITVNMDEYVGLEPSHPESYHYFMKTNFFDHIDIDLKNTHLLDGLAIDTTAECLAYERMIKSLGGINLFIGGIGSDGHIAFNEPGSSLTSRTREVRLLPETIRDNSRFFDNDPSKVPTRALTVGIGTVSDAQEVMILISGPNKAHALSKAVEGNVTQMYPISALQLHPSSIIVCDDAAAVELQVKTFRFYKQEEMLAKDELDY
jgi:glucosamine-6-phosphate isomerase